MTDCHGQKVLKRCVKFWTNTLKKRKKRKQVRQALTLSNIDCCLGVWSIPTTGQTEAVWMCPEGQWISGWEDAEVESGRQEAVVGGGTHSYLVWEERVGGLEGQMEADEWLWPPLEGNSPKEKNKDSSGVWWTAWSLSPHTPELQHFSKNICMPCTFDFRLLQCFQKLQGLSPAPWIAVAAWWQ